MKAGKDNVIAQKSYVLALEIIKEYKVLSEQREFVLSRQILRCGTSVGANIHEAVASESKKDFIHKLGISLKEARETLYWLNLLKDTNYISLEKFQFLNFLCEEIVRILNSIILTTKKKYFLNNDIHHS